MKMKSRLEIAVEMLKAGEFRLQVVRATGLTADQVDEIKRRIKP